jgi:hypothetical protein
MGNDGVRAGLVAWETTECGPDSWHGKTTECGADS